MNSKVTLWVAMLLACSLTSASAIERTSASGADSVGSAACRAVQLDAQAAVRAGEPYRNHGKLVSTAAHVVSDAVQSGTIDGECASCIISQFARGIPIADQTPCGVEVVLGTTANLLGPEISLCDGPVVGSTNIAPLSNGDLRCTVTFTGGPPNLTAAAYWTCTSVPNGCHDSACGFVALDPVTPVTTDGTGHGVAAFVLAGGNPFPGQYVHIDLICSLGCSAAGGIYTSIFPAIPAVATLASLGHQTLELGDPISRFAHTATPKPNATSLAAVKAAPGLTNIEAAWMSGAECNLQILDVAGRVVQSVTLRAGSDGKVRFAWDGSVRTGGKAHSGAYFARIGSPSVALRGLGRILLIR